MRDRNVIERAIALADRPDGGTDYPSMTYEQGVAEALMWVIGDISHEEFEFTPPLEF